MAGPLALVLLLCIHAQAGAQIPNASAAAIGMARNFTAMARGANAPAWNPGALGLIESGGASFSMILPTVFAGSGLGPIGLSDLSDYEDQVLPASVRDAWLSRIDAAGGQGGAAEAEITYLALRIGPVGFHGGTVVHARTSLSPGLARLVLEGNVRNGQPVDLELGGSTLDVQAYSSFGVSMGLPLFVAAGEAGLGATVTYTMGHILATGEESVGQATADPLEAMLEFPLVETNFDEGSANNGSGFMVDVGGLLLYGKWSFGAVVKNLMSTFSWEQDNLRYRPLTLTLDADSAVAGTEAQPFTTAPGPVIERIDDLGFKPEFIGAASYAPDARLTLAAEVRARSASGISTGATSHIGAGAQFRPLPFLPLRAGAARVSLGAGDSGWQMGGGVGVELGGYALGASVLRRDTEHSGAITAVLISLGSIGLR
jgi:hypothetical protein